MSTLSENKKLVEQYFEAVGAADLDAAISMMAPNLRWWCSAGTGCESETVFESPQELHAVISQAQGEIYDMTKGVCPEILRLTAEGDRVVAEVRIRGLSKLSGQEYHNNYVFIFSICDGKFCEVQEHLDTAYANRVLLNISGDSVGYEPPT